MNWYSHCVSSLELPRGSKYRSTMCDHLSPSGYISKGNNINVSKAHLYGHAFFLLLCVWVCISVYMFTTCMQEPVGVSKGCHTLGNQSYRKLVASCGCWDSNCSTLGRQWVFLTTKPPFQHLKSFLKYRLDNYLVKTDTTKAEHFSNVGKNKPIEVLESYRIPKRQDRKRNPSGTLCQNTDDTEQSVELQKIKHQVTREAGPWEQELVCPQKV